MSIKRHEITAFYGGDTFTDTETGGYYGSQEMLSSPSPPTAIICASDLSALGVIKAVHERGLSIPNSLSLIGFGDFSVADYTLPRLTTIRQSRITLGRTAADLLIRLANGEEIRNKTLTTQLILRDSTAPAPQLDTILP